MLRNRHGEKQVDRSLCYVYIDNIKLDKRGRVVKYVKLKKGDSDVFYLHDDVATALWTKTKVPKKSIHVYMVLLGEVSNGNQPSLSRISERISSVPANVSRDIKRLEEAGMIEVVRTPAKKSQYKFPHPDHWRV